ncbi:MAG: hypothetical protein H6741_27460 [Alphaproteobacteria bacterium]|nr:hypothetical protein [Alphaproteobacteria bacterium]MCB9796451.1 hypothetical protein [Alphaproteobacteria bacterium]
MIDIRTTLGIRNGALGATLFNWVGEENQEHNLHVTADPRHNHLTLTLRNNGTAPLVFKPGPPTPPDEGEASCLYLFTDDDLLPPDVLQGATTETAGWQAAVLSWEGMTLITLARSDEPLQLEAEQTAVVVVLGLKPQQERTGWLVAQAARVQGLELPLEERFRFKVLRPRHENRTLKLGMRFDPEVQTTPEGGQLVNNSLQLTLMNSSKQALVPAGQSWEGATPMFQVRFLVGDERGRASQLSTAGEADAVRLERPSGWSASGSGGTWVLTPSEQDRPQILDAGETVTFTFTFVHTHHVRGYALVFLDVRGVPRHDERLFHALVKKVSEPRVVRFTAPEQPLPWGAPARLSWEAHWVERCLLRVGEGEPQEVAARGEVEVLAQSTREHVWCSLRAGEQSCERRFSIQPPSATLNAAPQELGYGEPLTLTWRATSSARRVLSVNGEALGEVEPEGQRAHAAITPEVQVQLRAEGAGAPALGQARATVRRPDIQLMQVVPPEVSFLDPIWIRWSGTGGLWTLLENDRVIGQDLPGTHWVKHVVRPREGTTTATYTLRLQGAGWGIEHSREVQVPRYNCLYFMKDNGHGWFIRRDGQEVSPGRQNELPPDDDYKFFCVPVPGQRGVFRVGCWSGVDQGLVWTLNDGGGTSWVNVRSIHDIQEPRRSWFRFAPGQDGSQYIMSVFKDEPVTRQGTRCLFIWKKDSYDQQRFQFYSYGHMREEQYDRVGHVFGRCWG